MLATEHVELHQRRKHTAHELRDQAVVRLLTKERDAERRRQVVVLGAILLGVLVAVVVGVVL